MNYFPVAKKVLFSKEYYITAKIIPISGYVGACAHVAFYFLCVAQGYWESFTLRLMMAALWVPLLLFPRSGNLKTAHKCYWETTLFISLPLFFCYMFLKNEFVTYWYISLLWACLVYGTVSGKAYIPMVLTPLAFALTLLVFSFQTETPLSLLIGKSVGAFSISYLTSIVMAWLKLSTDVYYLLSLDAQTMSIKAAEEAKRRKSLESINAELHKRNLIISTFVRPSVLREMELGSDPRLFAPRITDKAILICDMRNFTPLTSTMLHADAQAEFINLYYQMMIEQVFKAGGEVDKLMGDAVMALFPDGRTALDAAIQMRLTLQAHNRKLIEAGKAKIGNVISISKGPALEANIGSIQKLDRTCIGAAVNVCARLESIAKLYGLDVIVTKEILNDVPEYRHCRLIDIIKVKGYDKKFEVFEIYGHQNATVVDFKTSTRSMLQKGIEFYFKKGSMVKAVEVFLQILKQTPRHNYIKDRKMDEISRYFAFRCLKWLSNPDQVGDALNLMEGCYDFASDNLPRDWYRLTTDEIVKRLEHTKL